MIWRSALRTALISVFSEERRSWYRKRQKQREQPTPTFTTATVVAYR
jgi:hypothetical protein